VRILITGAAGFVAQHLVHRLSQMPGAELFGLSLGSDPRLPNLRVYECDIRDAGKLESLVHDIRPTHIVHLAAISFVPQATSEPDAVFQINVQGTRNLLEAAASLGSMPTVLNISTGQVYDASLPGPYRETSPIRPQNMYAATKAMAELWAELYRDRLNWINGRAFNHTGPGQSAAFSIASWTQRVAAIKAGECEPVIYTGNLNVARDFTDVRDVVDAYILLLRQGRPWETYNVCSGMPTRLRDVMQMLLEVSEVDAEIVVDEARLRASDPACIVGDNSKIAAALGWHPQISLRTTLGDMLSLWAKKSMLIS
jgi:nucleoside-diphosphate-sugar epimerase